MLCRCWLWEGKPLHKRCWEANALFILCDFKFRSEKLNPISYNNSFFVLFFSPLLETVARHPEKLDRETYTVDVLILLTTSQGWSLAAEVGPDSQSVADKDGGRRGLGGGGGGGQARSPLSAEVFLCRVSHIFPLLAVALVVWLVVLVTFGAGGGALLPVVAALKLRMRYPGLSSLVASRWSAGSVALCAVITDNSSLFSVSAGALARLLLGCFTRRAIRVRIAGAGG